MGTALIRKSRNRKWQFPKPCPCRHYDFFVSVSAMLNRDFQGFIALWSAAELAAQIKSVRPTDVAEICETLDTMSRAREKGEKFSR